MTSRQTLQEQFRAELLALSQKGRERCLTRKEKCHAKWCEPTGNDAYPCRWKNQRRLDELRRQLEKVGTPIETWGLCSSQGKQSCLYLTHCFLVNGSCKDTQGGPPTPAPEARRVFEGGSSGSGGANPAPPKASQLSVAGKRQRAATTEAAASKTSVPRARAKSTAYDTKRAQQWASKKDPSSDSDKEGKFDAEKTFPKKFGGFQRGTSESEGKVIDAGVYDVKTCGNLGGLLRRAGAFAAFEPHEMFRVFEGETLAGMDVARWLTAETIRFKKPAKRWPWEAKNFKVMP